MLQNAFGQFIGGIIFGVAASLAGAAVHTATREGSDGLRDLAKGAVKSYLTAADRVQESADELRRGFDDLVAEARAEHEGEASPTGGHANP